MSIILFYTETKHTETKLEDGITSGRFLSLCTAAPALGFSASVHW